MGNFFKQKTVTADYVSTLQDKHCTILETPRYEIIPSIDDPNKKVEKLIIFVELKDEQKSSLDYYPNNTSQKEMAKAWGFNMDSWIGKTFEFTVNLQNVRGKMQNVMYVKI